MLVVVGLVVMGLIHRQVLAEQEVVGMALTGLVQPLLQLLVQQIPEVEVVVLAETRVHQVQAAPALLS
jgi:hypothetical protein